MTHRTSRACDCSEKGVIQKKSPDCPSNTSSSIAKRTCCSFGKRYTQKPRFFSCKISAIVKTRLSTSRALKLFCRIVNCRSTEKLRIESDFFEAYLENDCLQFFTVRKIDRRIG